MFTYFAFISEPGYSQTARFLGMIGFGLLAFYDYKKDNTWFFIWLGSAVLINPIFEIQLDKDIWSVEWAVILLMSIFIKRIT